MVEASSSAARTFWLRSKAPSRLLIIRAAIMLALAALALATPGFLSAPSLTTLLTTISFVGCVAIAMTFVTIGGNIMSFALGATAAVSAMVFVVVLNTAGYAAGVAAALAAGAAISGLQGCLIGFLRANPIIVSIAAT